MGVWLASWQHLPQKESHKQGKCHQQPQAVSKPKEELRFRFNTSFIPLVSFFHGIQNEDNLSWTEGRRGTWVVPGRLDENYTLLCQGHSRLGTQQKALEMGIQSCLEGPWAWSDGLMQRRSVPEELILVNFPEAAVCLTGMEEKKHSVGNKYPAKGTSAASCCPTSASCNLNRHTSDLLMLKGVCGPNFCFCPSGSCFWSPFWSPPSCFSSLQSLEWFYCPGPLLNAVFWAQMLDIPYPPQIWLLFDY